MSWDGSGNGLGTFWDGFGLVLQKEYWVGSKDIFSKMAGSMFPASGHFRIAF